MATLLMCVLATERRLEFRVILSLTRFGARPLSRLTINLDALIALQRWQSPA